MTHKDAQSDQTPQQDRLDALLRRWHDENKTAAAASRDQLLARLAADRNTDAHGETHAKTHAQPPTQAQPQQAADARAAVLKLAMWRLIMHRYTRIAASMIFVLTVLALLFPPTTQQSMAQDGFIMLPDGGRLDAFNERGEHIGPCPLKHTEVDVHIAGHFSRTTVTQTYNNPYQHKVEAVYTFPLGHNGAVDRMTMTIGDRVIKGEVQERVRARETYEAARDQGYVASLLEQERPNIFTQSIANIEPGAEIIIEISYVEVLESVDGEYTFVFPMVVAPRYIPGSPLGLGYRGSPSRDARLGEPSHQPGTFAPDTDQVEDASRVTPMPVKPDVRAGHDISVQVRIETGGPGIKQISSGQHDIVQYQERRCSEREHITGVSIALKAETEIPNRDFILSWKQTGDGIEEAVFTHMSAAEKYGPYSGGFFTMILQPPHRVADEDARPRELIFVMDNSGSMRGARLDEAGYSALDAAKDVINKAIDTMRPNDRFNVISFNNSLATLWDAPRPNTPENRAIAQQFVDQRQGGGGTEMANAVFAALGAHQFAPQEQRDMLSPKALANLPADRRRVSVQAPLEDVHVHQTRRGDDYRLRVTNDLYIDLVLHADLPTVLQPHGVNVRLDGNWVTRDGRRLFIVDRIEMLDAPPDDDADLMRIVLFVTDGLVGNDEAIINAVREHSGQSRMFTIGMSRSPNRYLLDKMAQAGRGAADYVLPGDDVTPIVQRFADRIATPVLTDITLEFDGVEVVDVLPGAGQDRLPDLFDFSPLVIHGRYTEAGTGTLTIRGRTGAGPYERTLDLQLPQQQEEHDVIATLWARANIDRLMIDDAKDKIIAMGEQFQIMSKYTSFVAVEMQRKTVDGKSVLVRVPIEFPEGMSWEGVFGGEADRVRETVASSSPSPSRPDAMPMRSRTLAVDELRTLPAPSSQAPSAPPVPPADFRNAPQFDLNQAIGQPPAGSISPGIGGGRRGGGDGAGGGGLFGDPGDERAATTERAPLSLQERREHVANLVLEMIEPSAWVELGGSLAQLNQTRGRIVPVPRQRTVEAEMVVTQARQFLNAHEAIFSGAKDFKPPLASEGKFPARDGDGNETLIVVYDVRQLVDTQHYHETLDSLINILEENFEPESWRSMGGNTGVFEEFDGFLFIRTTAAIHDQVRQLLAMLRKELGLPLDDSMQLQPVAEDAVPLRLYDVRPRSKRDIQRVIDTIHERIDTNNWFAMGGDVGSITHFEGLLIIRTTPANHEAIERLLKNLP